MNNQEPSSNAELYTGVADAYSLFPPPWNISPMKKHRPQADAFNSDVPQMNELGPQKQELIKYLLKLYKRHSKPPIVLIEHTDGHNECFTNQAMRRSLTDVLGKNLFRKLVTLITINAQEPVFLPVSTETDTIFILGGSTNFTDDNFGRAFVKDICRPLVEEIGKSTSLRALGVCFGYQGLVEAFGKSIHIPIVTRREQLQFGYYPVHFKDTPDQLWVKPLASKVPRQVCFTRSGYPRLEDESLSFSDIDEITSLARINMNALLTLKSDSSRYMESDPNGSNKHVDPMVSMHGGKVIGAAFHPEFKPRKSHLEPVRVFLRHASMEELGDIVRPDFEIQLSAKRHPKSIADVFLIGLLGKWAKELADG